MDFDLHEPNAYFNILLVNQTSKIRFIFCHATDEAFWVLQRTTDANKDGQCWQSFLHIFSQVQRSFEGNFVCEVEFEHGGKFTAVTKLTFTDKGLDKNPGKKNPCQLLTNVSDKAILS